MKEIAEGLARRPEGESQCSLVDRLRACVEMEARSGSRDPGCITPLYIYRMWGGCVSMEEIEAGLQELRRGNFF